MSFREEWGTVLNNWRIYLEGKGDLVASFVINNNPIYRSQGSFLVL